MSAARHFKELLVWQLADSLRGEVFKLTARPDFTRDLKLRAQAEDAIQSTCRNIAEGFGADTHREFARFLRIARRSLNELQDIFEGALEKSYVTSEQLAAARLLLRRLYPALNRFVDYLDGTPEERNDARRPRKPPLGDPP